MDKLRQLFFMCDNCKEHTTLASDAVLITNHMAAIPIGASCLICGSDNAAILCHYVVEIEDTFHLSGAL